MPRKPTGRMSAQEAMCVVRAVANAAQEAEEEEEKEEGQAQTAAQKALEMKDKEWEWERKEINVPEYVFAQKPGPVNCPTMLI